MQVKNEILIIIKSTVKKILPDAEIILFGSRADESTHDESDWDILVLTTQQVTAELKKRLHNKIFPLSVAEGSFINLLLISQKDWQQNPSYYSLKKSISANNISL